MQIFCLSSNLLLLMLASVCEPYLPQRLLWCSNGSFLFHLLLPRSFIGILLQGRAVPSLPLLYLFNCSIYLYQYSLIGNYFSLWVLIQCYHLFCCQIVFASVDWNLFRVGSRVHSFFEHFLTFWNHNIFQAYLVSYIIFPLSFPLRRCLKPPPPI